VKRGDVVAVAAAGDYGKPRPAVIVQTDALPARHASVIVDAPHLRVTIEPSGRNGLKVRSQVIADKPVTVRRERVGQRLGSLGPQEMTRVNAALAFVMGLSD
jgi:mRNA interferase MazF